MQKRTREIIALVLLIVLGIAGVSAMAWYILVGHSWNAAASLIDDHFGSMEGYTVVLCEGTMPYNANAEDAKDVAPEERAVGEPVREIASDIPDDESLSIAHVAESYVEKDAQVVMVDVENPRDYADPVIVSRNGKRIAVFYASGPRADLAARQMVKQLRHYAVNVSICITDDLEAVERGLGRVDIAICTDRKAIDENGYIGKTYTVGLPYVGQVRAVLLAPSGYVSSKAISSL
ncbi:MAG: hypothetical protein IJ111_00400 [Eggerthellaceae bacterium]|nr:hypothetical protein [Eggerthellaceae bacterium]